MKLKYSIIAAILFTTYVYAQDNNPYLDNCDDCYQFVETQSDIIDSLINVAGMAQTVKTDTIYLSTLDTILHHFNLSFDEFTNTFQQYVRKNKDSLSYKDETNIYLNHLLPLLLEARGTKQYFVNAYIHNSTRKKPDTLSFTLPEDTSKLNLDVLLMVKGEANTYNFLNSPNIQANTLFDVLKKIDNIQTNTHKRIGLNVYFPDYTFEHKKAMAQFVKSVSLVIDSSKIKSIRNLPLYLTYDQKYEAAEEHFLTGLNSMVDSIYVTNPADGELLFTNFKKSEEKGIAQIINQFYFARYNIGQFPKTSNKHLFLSDIKLIMHSDYPHNWEKYLFAIVLLFVLLIVATLLYFFTSWFSSFVHDNSMYVFAAGLLLVLEAYLLFMSMIEGMSEISVFSFQNNDKILLLPVLLMLVIPIIKRMTRSQEKP